MEQSLQLDMNFENGSTNRFRTALDEGRFTALVECSLPEGEVDRDGAASRLAMLEKAVLGCTEINTGLALTDFAVSNSRWRAAEFATLLSSENRDRHVVYVSGRNTSGEQAADLIKIAANAGICNIVPVSGTLNSQLSSRDCRKLRFTESTMMLRMMQNSSIFSGGAVNPFQYMAYPLFAQYFKAVKKLNLGAGFLVTQAGWDMLRIQSFAWFMMNRKLYYPKLARLMILTPERVEDILANRMAGIRISNDFRRILERELHYSKNQFEAAQYRRIELQAAGCRLMGFSGIQLAGAENPARVQTVLSRIDRALKEYVDFSTWLEEYNAYMASAEMAPFSNNFQLFDPILSRDYPLDGDGVASHEPGDPDCGLLESLMLGMRRSLFRKADTQRAGHLKFAKTLLAGCRSCEKCRLPLTEYVCTETCPKRLADGPCGGIRPNGLCEHGNFECIHSKIVRYAHCRGALHELETKMVEQA